MILKCFRLCDTWRLFFFFFFLIIFFFQEHFLDNAKLSENYFIANCEDMLVCFYHAPTFSYLRKYLVSTLTLDVNYTMDTRKLLLLLMSCPLGCMISTFSASGNIFCPFEEVKNCLQFYCFRNVITILVRSSP